MTIDGKNRCGNIQWVPFAEHPKGVNFIPRYNETTEDPLDVPYYNTSVWYDPRIDGVGAGLVSREVKVEVEDPAVVEKKKAEAEAAHAEHKKEAKELAGGNLHEEHKALAEVLLSHEAEVPQSPEVGHREVISNAAAAALKAEQAEDEEVHIFPPLLRGAESGIPKGRFHLGPMKLMSKHGVQHLPIQVQLSVMIMVIGICAAVIVSVGGKSKNTSKSKKRG